MLMAVMTVDDIASDDGDENDEEIGDAVDGDDHDHDHDEKDEEISDAVDGDDHDHDEKAEEIGDAEVLVKVHKRPTQVCAQSTPSQVHSKSHDFSPFFAFQKQ